MRKRLSPNLAFAPNPQRTRHGRRRRVVVETEERDVSPPLLPLLNDRTLIVFVHPRGFVIFIISLLPCPS
jgi:hypothetical protein